VLVVLLCIKFITYILLGFPVLLQQCYIGCKIRSLLFDVKLLVHLFDFNNQVCKHVQLFQVLLLHNAIHLVYFSAVFGKVNFAIKGNYFHLF